MRKTMKLLLILCSFFYHATAHAQSNPLEPVKNYLDNNRARFSLQEQDYAGLAVTRNYKEQSGIERVYVQQKLSGIDVVGGSFSLHTNPRTGYATATSNLLPIHQYQKSAATPTRTPEFAAGKVLELLNATNEPLQVKQPATGVEKKTVFRRGDVKLWDVPVRLVYLADDKNKKLKLAWEVQVYEYSQQHYWMMFLDDATGKLLRKMDLVLKCNFDGGVTDKHNHGSHAHQLAVEQIIDNSAPLTPFLRDINITANKYRVYDLPFESPVDAGATHGLVQGKENDLASPDGWHRVANAISHNYTRGNNAWAFYDPSPGPLGGVPNPATAAISNGGIGGTPNLVEPYTFDYPINLSQQPETYRNAAIVNLFYWNNLIHDVYYQFGFTEDAANFQSSHTFSTGTRGSITDLANDEVWAQAQDGGGTNNANFLTLPDGVNGQMQMYLWTAALPDSIVQIRSSSTGVPPPGTKFVAVQGSFATVLPRNLHTDSVSNRQFVIVQKNALSTVGDSTEGCTTGQQGVALPPSNDVAGKIVLIDRGNCSFVEKVFGAQLGGAAGVIIINNIDGPPMAMGGTDATANLITIPAVMISKADGEYLKAQIRAGAIIFGSLKQDNPPAPKRDGDVDNGVIAHEYGHGISSRLTGGGTSTGPLGGDEQGGEGWSDFIALHMITRTNDLMPATPAHPNGVLPTKGIGTYVVYQNINTGGGIRPTPYSIDKNVNPSLFKDIAKGGEITVPHGVGYIWCSMLYEMMQNLVDLYGFNDNIYNAANPDVSGAPAAGSGGNNVAMRLVMEGMKIQPTSPTFEQQRNAILSADSLLYGARHSCVIWKAFAKRGLGFSARSGGNALGDEVQGFDLPQVCNPDQVRLNIDLIAPERIDNNTTFDYSIVVRNVHTAAVNNIVIEDSIPVGTSLLMASDGGVQVGNKIVWNLASLAQGATKTLTMTLSINLPSASELIFFDNHEATTQFTNDARPDTWQLVSRDAYSGTKTWYAREVENPAHNVTLTQVSQVAIPPQGAKLSFYHKFNTEAGFDGGVVEVSADNGATWTYLPAAAFEKNGYNSIIATLDNPNIGTTDLAAFSGATSGYINSIADLGEYAGQQVRLRFRFTCDVQTLASGTDPGWYVDDVYVIRNLTSITNYVSAGLQTGNENVFDSTGNQPIDSAVTLVFQNSALPTALSNLAATASTNHIRLSWKTFSETGNAGFELQRKAEGEADFKVITFIKGAGDSNKEVSYSYNDGDVKQGVYYHYQLKQKDADGRFSYSNVAIARLGAKADEIVFDIVPNPVTTTANFVVSTPGRKTGTLRLYDAMGKRIATFNTTSAYSGIQRYEVNVATLPAGTYWAELVVDDVRMTKPVVINR